MGRIWSEESKYQAWLGVELAVCEAYARRGRIPRDALARIRAKARVDIARILAVQERVKHEMIALLTSLEEQLGPDSRIVARTHGVHAEPTTFGLKVLVWYAEAGRNLERLRRARAAVAVGKLSGAVGQVAPGEPGPGGGGCRG